MKDGLFLIGEVSKSKGITVKALRFYDEIGLLKPHLIDPESGYRYYHPDQMLPIDIIKAARSLEISPNQLIPFFEKKDTAGLMALLLEHREKTEERLNRLRNVVAGTERICENYRQAGEASARSDVYRRHIPDLHALSTPWVECNDPQDYLSAYAELDRRVDELGLIATHEAGVLFAIREHTTVPDFLFTTVAHSFPGNDYLLIPGGEYVCVSFSESCAIARQKLLNRYIAKNRLEPRLILQAELLTEVFREKDPVWELRVLISAE